MIVKMYLRSITFVTLFLYAQVHSYPNFYYRTVEQQPQYAPSPLTRKYAYTAQAPATYVQYAADPNTGVYRPATYVTHSRPGGPVTALLQNVLNTVGRLIGDVGGAVGNALGGTLAGAGQFGQDIQDFMKPITVAQIVRPHPDPPITVVPAPPPTNTPQVRPPPPPPPAVAPGPDPDDP